MQKVLNKNEITMTVFIDYSEAFDTIQHETLIRKLANLNFINNSIEIILSYLNNSIMHNQMIKNLHINQYILGFHRAVSLALFFNVYVSSLLSCLKFNSIQYADDSSLYLSNSIRNIQSTISILKTDTKNHNTWSENV